ncbi:hypothetical protein P154DRAFT_524963 [Amniculicola lignicola CBS 123094]|uniref:Uncharacterized protein n=1 Tax=Amniculicola lignicola CBS 123094 TaxID=1392246 RepID=A0A6A5WDU1_9PLEO|nr:hypothetical protein P154DRAFT_524963 [Amniculicola lignicola CBS 123094]
MELVESTQVAILKCSTLCQGRVRPVGFWTSSAYATPASSFLQCPDLLSWTTRRHGGASRIRNLRRAAELSSDRGRTSFATNGYSTKSGVFHTVQ